MTLLKERMESAGVDVPAARLNVLAIAALRECNGSIAAAADSLFQKLRNEPSVVIHALLMPYLTERQADMRGGKPVEFGECRNLPNHAAPPPPSAQPPRRQPNPQRRLAVAQIVESAVKAIRFKHLTSDGRDWADVGAHELDGMDRDGALARAIKDRLGTLSNEQRFKPVGELMAAKTFNELRAGLT